MLRVNTVVTAFQGVFDIPDHRVDPRKQLIIHRFVTTTCHNCSMWVSGVSYSCECTESVTDNAASITTKVLSRPEFQLLFPETGDHTESHIQRVIFFVGLHGGNKGVFVFRASSPFASMFFTTPVSIIHLHMPLQGTAVIPFFHYLHEFVL